MGLLLALYFPLDPSDLACKFLKTSPFISLHLMMHAVIIIIIIFIFIFLVLFFSYCSQCSC